MTERQRLKVSSKTRPQVLAGAITKFLIDDHKEVEIIAIGAGANQQCTKALILARKFCSTSGMNLAFIPGFETLEIDGKEITANKWIPVRM